MSRVPSFPWCSGRSPSLPGKSREPWRNWTPGLIEAALAMGSSPWEIIFRVYLKESVASIARGTTITAISLLNLTAMAGVVGAGGLGDFAIRYGHDRNMMDVTNVTVLILVLFVCIIEFAGGRVVKKNTH